MYFFKFVLQVILSLISVFGVKFDVVGEEFDCCVRIEMISDIVHK